jgi:dephospho-CoA kinase
MKPAFTFSGAIGSGKSTVSSQFARRIGAKWNSFGNTVRRIAAEQGIDPSRQNLQRLGAAAVEMNQEELCRKVIEGTEGGDEDYLVIDGVRHERILDCLRKSVSPRTLVAVFVDSPEQIRLERLRTRDGLSMDQITELQRHSTETEVETKLRTRADIVVSNAGRVEECENALFRWAKDAGFVN